MLFEFLQSSNSCEFELLTQKVPSSLLVVEKCLKRKVIIDIKISPYRILQEHEVDDAEV